MCVRDLEVCLEPVSQKEEEEPPCGLLEVCMCGDPGCVQRGVGVEMCPVEPPHDLENEGVCV